METKESNTTEEEQLAMDIPHSRFERFYNFKRKVENVEESIKFVPINRTVSYWIVLIFSLFTVGFIAYEVVNYFGQLPTVIPLLFSQIDSTWLLLPKENLLIYAFIPLMNIFILLTFIRNAYQFHRRLATAIMVIMNISNVLILIAVIEVISLSIV